MVNTFTRRVGTKGVHDDRPDRPKVVRRVVVLYQKTRHRPDENYQSSNEEDDLFYTLGHLSNFGILGPQQHRQREQGFTTTLLPEQLIFGRLHQQPIV